MQMQERFYIKNSYLKIAAFERCLGGRVMIA
jgi:hypothetical protein